MKIVISTFVVIVVAATIIILGKKAKNDSLNSCNINGVIDKYQYFFDKYDQNKNYATVIVKTRRYKIFTRPAYGNEFTIYDVTRVGDTIRKKFGNDTLTLNRKGDSVYHFQYIVKQCQEN